MVELDIALFTTTDAHWEKSLDEYLNIANYNLVNFDLRLNVYPPRPGSGPVVISPTGFVYDRVPDLGPDVRSALLAGDLRNAANIALPQSHGIPVIFCRFRRSDDAGLTVFTQDSGVNRGVSWLNYVLVNGDVFNATRSVVLHELIHAANYSGDIDPLFGRNLHDSNPTSLMRPRSNLNAPAETMTEKHAAALRASYFARTI